MAVGGLATALWAVLRERRTLSQAEHKDTVAEYKALLTDTLHRMEAMQAENERLTIRNTELQVQVATLGGQCEHH